MNADPIVLEPGSPEWLREMTASKVAAVLGLSPWESRFSLWYRMAGAVDTEDPETPAMRRGHYLEDAICRYVADEHGLTLAEGGCWRNRTRPWQVASPDRRVIMARNVTYAVVEVKTAADYERWGPDGSDEIPVYYRTQAVWQCDTLGVDRCYVGVLLPRLELRSYVIRPAPGEAEYIREEVRAFLDSLAAGDPPDVDTHGRTYDTLRSLHPSIDGSEVEVSEADAAAWCASVVRYRQAEDEFNLQRSRMARLMGDAKTAAHEGRKVAGRQPGPTGVPYVAATRSKATLAAFADLHTPPPTPEETPDA